MRELSRREADSVLLRAVGVQAKEGAQIMGISIHTYRNHLKSAFAEVNMAGPRSLWEFAILLKNRSDILSRVRWRRLKNWL